LAVNIRHLFILIAVAQLRAAVLEAASDGDLKPGALLSYNQSQTAGFDREAFAALPTPVAQAEAPVRPGLEMILGGLPPLSLDKKGRPDSPVNLLFVGSEESLRAAIADAKWTTVSASMLRSVAGGFLELFKLRKPAHFPPISPEYLFGRAQDMGFAQLCGFVRSRHHFRLWRTSFSGPRGEPVWAGTAAFDEALEFYNRTRGGHRVLGFGHRINPKIDNERDYIKGTLRALPEVARILYAPHPKASYSGFDSDLNPFETDGRVLAVFLR
jgi:undecaprenyl-diphosphatase